jgi:hypothetical protein
VLLHIDTNEPGWWGEGDDMFFVDGEAWPPHLHGTGTEDYFCGAWNYNKLDRPFAAPYFGYHYKGNADYTGKHSQYRFHSRIRSISCGHCALASSTATPMTARAIGPAPPTGMR